jgi:hypothetical protein
VTLSLEENKEENNSYLQLNMAKFLQIGVCGGWIFCKEKQPH